MNNSTKIQAWVVRSSAFSIQCGGLERLFIHFKKPIFYYRKHTAQTRDTPFEDITEQQGLFHKIGWESNPKTWVNYQSVGNWLGYDNPVSDYIWGKLCEHFLNEPFDTWHTLEQEGKVNIEDFCLEIELEISIPSLKESGDNK